jgi:lipoprotein-anchoring transpeptidase ErfK/SrfK
MENKMVNSKTFFLGLLIAFFVWAPGLSNQALADVVAKVDLSSQKMRVIVNGRTEHVWPISSGRKGYRTPTGRYSPKRMHREYYSKKYNGSPMPYSIFFRGGYAVHGTNYVKRLGRPASHGCIRLKTTHARQLYNLVRAHGRKNAVIDIRY